MAEESPPEEPHDAPQAPVSIYQQRKQEILREKVAEAQHSAAVAKVQVRCKLLRLRRDT